MTVRLPNAGAFLLGALLIVLAGVAGYLVGHGHSASAPAEAVRDASNANALLEYPERAGWEPASRVPTIPGLSITRPLVLAPGGNPSEAGLVEGELASEGWSPLPAGFLSHTRGLPKTEVVELANTEAYRYSGLETGAPSMAFTLYTIPSSGSSEAAVACYAPEAEARTMRACEGIAGGLTVTYPAGDAPIDDLIPQTTYAHEIDEALTRLNQLRTSLHAGTVGAVSPSTASTLAQDAASGVDDVRSTLASVQPPAAAEQVHAAFLSSLANASAAYSALATAAQSGEQAAFTEALTRVTSAETSLNSVLAGFSLLGYG